MIAEVQKLQHPLEGLVHRTRQVKSLTLKFLGPDFVEGGFEGVHVGLGADRDADFGGPGGPDAADQDFLGGHGAGEIDAGAVDFHHEEVGLAGDVLDVFLPEEGKDIFADLAVDAAAFVDEIRSLEAGGGAGEGGDREIVVAVLCEFLE